jgi:hypothetical protein
MLDVFLTNTDVALTIDLADADGNALSVSAVSYRLINQDGTELVALQAVSGFTAGDAQVVVTIPAALNQMADGSTREVRTVELICTLDAGTIGINKSYGVEALDPLAIPANSFQSFAMAEFTAMNIPNISAYNGASESDKIQALMDAREHIVQLNFNLLNSNVNFGQDQLAYVPEGQFQSSYVARNSLFIFNGNLAILNSTQFAALPEKFKRALRQAQIVEANAILGGEGDETRRSSGVIEDQIGETMQKYRQTVPLRLPVCRRALGYLSYYVTFAKRIGRAG